MPYVIGGIRIGSRNVRYTKRLPGKFFRASTYAAGAPTSTDSTTTSADTSSVTTMTWNNVNSCHASPYHWVVKPLGNQVSNHFLPNELTSTDSTTPARLTKKNTTTAQITQPNGVARICFIP